MARYQVVLSYDGTHFAGFQRQVEDRTVQGVVEDALKSIGWPGRSILAAGRTDAGVHALGQVIAFDLEWNHSLEALQEAINAHLPSDVAARHIQIKAEDFHPRYDALSRRYAYRILCEEMRNPLRERYAWRIWPAPDLAAMREAAQIFVGEHDFSAYGQPPKPGGSAVRRIFVSEWLDMEGGLSYRVAASGFLYHMVRRMVHHLVAIGQGRDSAEAVASHLADPQIGAAQGMAPPQGLYLEEVQYP